MPPRPRSIVRRPPDRVLRHASELLAPWRAATSPVFVGLDRVPVDRPLLFVGNHTIIGVLDIPLLFFELYERKGIYLRALGDHLHFKIPLWGRFLASFGVVDGTRENCAQLMAAGESILVFPGGGREVAKRKNEKYRLIWKERLGFARMAIEHGCTIVPFAAVGVEESLDIVVDSEEMLATPLGRVLARFMTRPEVVPPIVRGLGPTPIPRPERLYFWIAPPVRTEEFARDATEHACRTVRDRVRHEVQHGIDALHAMRESDPHRTFGARVANAIRQKPR
ncbi:MAG: lysophospholipid acyltransferase family protein [Deltaproteobacteria bacterium]